jgi:hypothetical protein
MMMAMREYQPNPIGIENPFRGCAIHASGNQVVITVNIDILGPEQALSQARVCLACATQSFDGIIRSRTSKRLPDVPQQYYSVEVWFKLTQELIEREIRVSEGIGNIAWSQVKVRNNSNLHVFLVYAR